MATTTVSERYEKTTPRSDVEAQGQQRVDHDIALRFWIEDKGDHWLLWTEMEVAQ